MRGTTFLRQYNRHSNARDRRDLRHRRVTEDSQNSFTNPYRVKHTHLPKSKQLNLCSLYVVEQAQRAVYENALAAFFSKNEYIYCLELYSLTLIDL